MAFWPSIFMVVIHMAKFHESIMKHTYFNNYESKKNEKKISIFEQYEAQMKL